ncbi:hypothetical protein [[Eubacterium] cellulosolvens]
MAEKIILEFYPELDIYALKTDDDSLNNRILLYPTYISLKMCALGRGIKRMINFSNANIMANKSKINIFLIKKFTNLKRYRCGKPVRLRKLPALVLDNKLLCDGNVLFKKEFYSLVKKMIYKI